MIMPPPPNLARTSPLQWVLLALILCIAAALRMVYIGATEPHWDELWHMELSTGRGSAHQTLPRNELIAAAPDVTSLAGAPGWRNIPTSLDTVTHPPLYQIMLRIWRAAFGDSVVIARGYSALLSVFCVWALFEVVRTLHGPSFALWAALILAIASAQIDTAQEVRNYAQSTLLCLCTAVFVVRIEASGTTRLRNVGLYCCTLAAMFTHYFVFPVIGALALYSILRMPRRTWISVCTTLVTAACVFAIVWGPSLLRQAEAFRGAIVPGALGEIDPNGSHLTDVLLRLAAIPIRLLFEARQGSAAFALAGAVMFALPWLLIARHRAMLLWALWFTSVVGLAVVLDLFNHTRHLEQLRHTILAGPAIIAAMATLLAWPGARPALAHAWSAVIVVACALALPLSYTRQNPKFSDIGVALVRESATNPQANLEPVIFYSDASSAWWADMLYLGASYHSQTFPRPSARLDHPATPDLVAELHRWPCVWLVFGRSSLKPEEIIPGAEVMTQRGEPFIGVVCHMRWREAASDRKAEVVR